MTTYTIIFVAATLLGFGMGFLLAALLSVGRVDEELKQAREENAHLHKVLDDTHEVLQHLINTVKK